MKTAATITPRAGDVAAADRFRQRVPFPATFLCVAFVAGVSAAGAAIADEPATISIPQSWTAADDDAATRAPARPKLDLSAEIESRKSYAIPPFEIIGFDVLLNRINRYREGPGDYDVTSDSIRRNLRSRWVVDNDPFSVNQFMHPYQGSMYHGFARSAGLNYWEALGYTFAGSALWEVAGEKTLPSRNDQIASGIAGTFLGESLFRMASLSLERDDGLPQIWHEIAAAAISPSTGFNRLAFGERFKTIFPSRDPAYYSRLQVGFTGTTRNDPGLSTEVKRNEFVTDFSMDYGLPGKPGYYYKRPFDYFTFQTAVASGNGFENIMTRGLLVGTDYKVGDNYRGIWGLYGSYDYLAPQIFRMSSTALSLGTTGQVWLTEAIAVQGTGLLGVGYAAVGTLHGTDEHDYHYGVAPQALLALRLIFGDKYSVDLTGREYFVSKVGATDPNSNDNIARLEASLTWRISGKHAVAFKYILSRRDSSYFGVGGDRSQSRGTIGIFYTLLGHDRFGAVDWRP